MYQRPDQPGLPPITTPARDLPMDLLPPYYPINDFDPLMKGLVIGGLGIFHVFLAQFAIGGGMLMCHFQWLAMTGRCPRARELLDSYFRFLVLLSFVLGALTGVAMWFTTIQMSARTIGTMVDAFHWVWAIEWTFFCVEVVAGYAFYRSGARLDDRTRLALLIIYSVAAWASLFWINGILSWQLTPGRWTGGAGAAWTNVWIGFFNPSFWPSLIYRTVASLTIAALVACAVINTLTALDRQAREDLVRRTARLLVPIALMPLLGLWYVLVLPADSRGWITGGSAAMTLFLHMAVGASLLVGAYALIGLWRQRLYINGATATLLVGLAFVASAGGEFVREGVRKPYTIRGQLYSNSIAPEEVRTLRRIGSVAHDPYALRDAARYPTAQLELGARVFRFQCAICHTLTGVNGLAHLTEGWDAHLRRHAIAKLQHLKGFMPPFAGTAAELEALVQRLDWHAAGEPPTWVPSEDPAVLATIAQWLAEAGPEPAFPATGTRSEHSTQ